MAERSNPGSEKGLAARHLILLFLAGVAVCAVFFSLGFLVGYNERSSGAAPMAERVTGPADIPPTVNPPAAKQSATKQLSSAKNPPSSQPTPAEVSPKASSAPTTSATVSSPPVKAPSTSLAPEGGNDESERPAPAAASAEVSTGFTVQVSASRTKQDAETLVSILKGRGYPVFLVAPEYSRASDNLFRVQVGPFRTRDEAERVRAKLAKEGLFKDLFIKH